MPASRRTARRREPASRAGSGPGGAAAPRPREARCGASPAAASATPDSSRVRTRSTASPPSSWAGQRQQPGGGGTCPGRHAACPWGKATGVVESAVASSTPGRRTAAGRAEAGRRTPHTTPRRITGSSTTPTKARIPATLRRAEADQELAAHRLHIQLARCGCSTSPRRRVAHGSARSPPGHRTRDRHGARGGGSRTSPRRWRPTPRHRPGGPMARSTREDSSIEPPTSAARRDSWVRGNHDGSRAGHRATRPFACRSTSDRSSSRSAGDSSLIQARSGAWRPSTARPPRASAQGSSDHPGGDDLAEQDIDHGTAGQRDRERPLAEPVCGAMHGARQGPAEPVLGHHQLTAVQVGRPHRRVPIRSAPAGRRPAPRTRQGEDDRSTGADPAARHRPVAATAGPTVDHRRPGHGPAPPVGRNVLRPPNVRAPRGPAAARSPLGASVIRMPTVWTEGVTRPVPGRHPDSLSLMTVAASNTTLRRRLQPVRLSPRWSSSCSRSGIVVAQAKTSRAEWLAAQGAAPMTGSEDDEGTTTRKTMRA